MKSLFALAVLAALGAGFIYSGLYNISADEPHWLITHKVIQTLRERSIGARAKDINVPALDDPKLIAQGAEHYAAMCNGCHLAPGMEDTEIRAGLYPRPPKLAAHAHGESHAGMDMQAMAARQFWIIKHGIKMTAMPAWGATHDDQSIWGLVAFLQKLPGMTPEEYAILTGIPGNESHVDGHQHHEEGSAASSAHPHGPDAATPQAAPSGHVDAPGTPPHGHGGDEQSEDIHEGDNHAD